MGAYFLDTSAVVKRYALEAGSGWVRALTDPAAGHAHFVARITLVEILSAISRKERGRSLPPALAAKALADFGYDFGRQYLVVEVSARLVDRAGLTTRRHALRAYDAVQLAAALEIATVEPSLIFVSADLDLNAAAASEGLSVANPLDHPPGRTDTAIAALKGKA